MGIVASSTLRDQERIIRGEGEGCSGYFGGAKPKSQSAQKASTSAYISPYTQAIPQLLSDSLGRPLSSSPSSAP